MTTRTITNTVKFHRPFSIKGVDHVMPPAEYRVVTEEKLLKKLSFTTFHRVSTVIFVPSGPAVEMVAIDSRP